MVVIGVEGRELWRFVLPRVVEGGSGTDWGRKGLGAGRCGYRDVGSGRGVHANELSKEGRKEGRILA